MSGSIEGWRRQGEAFWRTHHEAWKRSDLNQRQYCEAQCIPLKAFGNWRVVFKAEPHRGLSVIDVNEKVIDEICDARIAVETLAVRSLRDDPERIAQLATVLASKVATLAQRIRVGDLVAINHADIDFHRQLCVLSGNGIATTLWQAIARHIWIVFGWEIRSETSISRMVEQHERLAQALISSSDARAEAELIQHIRRRRS